MFDRFVFDLADHQQRVYGETRAGVFGAGDEHDLRYGYGYGHGSRGRTRLRLCPPQHVPKPLHPPQFSDWPARRQRHWLRHVRQCAGVEVRRGQRGVAKIQGGQVHPRDETDPSGGIVGQPTR